jgi:hypothetical protein
MALKSGSSSIKLMPGPCGALDRATRGLVADDTLSDVLIPMLDLNDTADPIEDYLAALPLLEGAADDVDVLVPGHGSIGGADRVHARIDQDRAYVRVLRDAGVPATRGSPREFWTSVLSLITGWVQRRQHDAVLHRSNDHAQQWSSPQGWLPSMPGMCSSGAGALFRARVAE